MEEAVIEITKDFDYSKIGNFHTEKLDGIVNSKKIDLPLVDVYFINPSVYRYFKKNDGLSREFKSELKKATERLLAKYGTVTIRTCFKFVGLENPRGLLSWRNLASLEEVLTSIKAAFIHGEEVAKKNKISQFELGLILIGRVNAQKGGIIIVDIEKEKLCSIDSCWGDAKLIAMGEEEGDTFLINEDLEIIKKKIRHKSVGYFFRGTEREKREVFLEKQDISSLSDKEAINLAKHSFRAARFHKANIQIEFMINKNGILDMYELQVEPGVMVSGQVKKKVKDKVLVRGLSACPGRIEGKVIVIREESDLEKISSGDVVVIHLPKADICLPIFSKAGAVITDCGGTTSHFATLARDFNIPCVVGTETATEVLKDDMNVIVDAERGKVSLSEE